MPRSDEAIQEYVYVHIYCMVYLFLHNHSNWLNQFATNPQSWICDRRGNVKWIYSRYDNHNRKVNYHIMIYLIRYTAKMRYLFAKKIRYWHKNNNIWLNEGARQKKGSMNTLKNYREYSIIYIELESYFQMIGVWSVQMVI